MSSLWINKKKKSELVALCEQLGLQTEGYLKSDLESILTEYLHSNERELSTDPTFAPYYDTVAARSPTKRSNTQEIQTRPRRRTSRYVAGSTSFDASTDAETTPEPTSERKTRSGSRALAARTPRTVRSLGEAVIMPLPPSPAVVADEIESRANAIMASAKKAVDTVEIKEKATSLRDILSNVISVNVTALSLEVILLLASLIPVSYEVTFPAVSALGTSANTYTVPDLFVLLTASFWAPFLTWLITAIILPMGNALLFNLVATTVTVKDGTESQADPLTFAVTKALLTYLVHYKGFSFGGFLGENAIVTVGTSVGRELQLIGAGIGGIAAIWEGILRR